MHRMRLFAMLLAGLAMGAAPRDGAAEALSLDAAVLTALEQNPELKAMQQDAAAAKAQSKQSRFWDDPMVGVRFYQVPLGKNLDKAMDIDYIVAQKFPFPGKVKAASEIAYHNYLHHLELLSGRGRELLRELKETYYRLHAVQQRIAVTRQIEGRLRGMVQAAQARLAANQTPAVDAVQGQTEIAKLLGEREVMRQEAKTLEAKLNQLMARPVDAEVRLPPKLEIPSWNADLAALQEAAVRFHPNMRSARHRIEEKNWAVKAAKREYYPDFNAQLEYVQRPGAVEDAFTGELMINLPLIVGKKRQGVKQAEAEYAGATYSEQAARNQVAFRVQEVFQKWQSAERLMRINRGTLLPQARQALEISANAYVAGKAYFLDVLNAARGLLDAQMEYWKAYENLATAMAELEEAVGQTREEFLAAKGEANVKSFDVEKTIGAEVERK
ncbi:MAG: TolC family protein [Deltaproteobacteria bacterium]|nr:TolC family protein [Deltaproteobacteria bacterium]